MANWRLEDRMQTLGERRFPHFLLVGDNGVAVRMDFSKSWFMEYHGPDLDAKFSVYRDPPLTGADDDMVLGPHCRVGKMWLGTGGVFRSEEGRLRLDPVPYLSRPLAPQDYEPLATNLKEVLRAHLQFPGAVPPKIERVRFLDPQLQPFDD
jgi:hypothetical protein